VIIVGADKDLRQCLDSNVIIWDPMAKREKLETLESFVQETGLRPEQWPDFQAVIGDSSDNIPGVPGVGPKTAAKIFDRLPDIKAITRGLDQLTPAERKKVEPHVEQLFTYRKLTTLRTDLLDQKNSEALIEAHRRIRPEHKTASAHGAGDSLCPDSASAQGGYRADPGAGGTGETPGGARGRPAARPEGRGRAWPSPGRG